MQKTLDAIISENKLAAIKKRAILHTFFTIRDITDMPNIFNKQLTVISLDFLKAFDRVDWYFICSALYKFGYGSNFIHMIQVAYTNIQSKIKINGLLSDPFTLMQGVHQGFPLSMLLYIIAVKVLAIFDASTRIKRVLKGDHEIKMLILLMTPPFIIYYCG